MSESVMYSRKNCAKRFLFDHNDLYDKSVTRLSFGAPGPDLLRKCCDIFEKATKHRMNIEVNSDALLFQYGSAIGNVDIRTTLATFLSEAYSDVVHKEDLVLTSGASYGLHHILSTLIDMNGIIFVDEVTYMIALDIFKQFPTMKVVSVKLNESGPDTNMLEELFKKYIFKPNEGKIFWGIYYTIPTYHNPTSILFSADVCSKIVDLARKYDILVVADDVYNLLNYHTEKPPKRLFAYDDFEDKCTKGNIISNGSFSKLIGPGFRVGWMECPPRCVEVLNSCGVLRSGGCQSNYASGILQSLIELGLAQLHIKMMSQHYKKRMLTVCNVLKENLPKGCTFYEPEGGYFIWISLPKCIDAGKLNNFCTVKYRLCFSPGSIFSSNSDYSNFLRIAISFYPDNVLKDAIKNLCTAIKEFYQCELD